MRSKEQTSSINDGMALSGEHPYDLDARAFAACGSRLDRTVLACLRLASHMDR